MIEHDEIPGFMAAMTMPFPATEEVAVDSLEVGDEIMFDIERLDSGEYHIFRVKEVGAEGNEPAESPNER